MEEKKFDYDAFVSDTIKRLKSKDKDLLKEKEKLFQPLLKQILEGLLTAELDEHLADEPSGGNRKNGYGNKLVKSSSGKFELQTPRDRYGTFEPQIVEKRQVLISEEIDAKVIRLYSKGLSVRDIQDEIEEIYGFSLSEGTLSGITDRVIPMVKEWQERPLEKTYCFVWLDAMFFKVREEGKVVSKALYNIIGVDTNGIKDLLGIYVSETEGAKFWLQVLTDLKRRGVNDIFIASIDNLNGFAEAIESVFPKTQVQLCIVHQIRNSTKFVSYKDLKAFTTDLKTIYQAPNKENGLENLGLVEDKWAKKYGAAFLSWRNNWERLSTFFEYPDEIRKVIYTTNIIEGFHRQVRKVTKTKGAFSSEMALLKLVYLTSSRMVEKWSQAIQNWPVVSSQLLIIFGQRFNPKYQ
jgi:transposase-like protein